MQNATRRSALILTLLVSALVSALALAAPDPAQAQARVAPRGGVGAIGGAGAVGGGLGTGIGGLGDGLSVDPLGSTLPPAGPDPSILRRLEPATAAPAVAAPGPGGGDCVPSAANNFCQSDGGGGDDQACGCQDAPVVHRRCCSYPYRYY